nr:MAG TPA: hypothetical protein [Caudoviricetes sp.]
MINKIFILYHENFVISTFVNLLKITKHLNGF